LSSKLNNIVFLSSNSLQFLITAKNAIILKGDSGGPLVRYESSTNQYWLAGVVR